MFTREEIIEILTDESDDNLSLLCSDAHRIRVENRGESIFLRALIEFSNRCQKNCLYCGLRSSNIDTSRYILSEDQIIDSAVKSYNSGYGSIVLQSGERRDREFISFVTKVIKEIKRFSDNKLGITLSCGEQNEETYREWFEAGAHRYLLRFETSKEENYYRLHPKDRFHSYSDRINAIKTLKKIGYMTGSGFMYNLPNERVEDIADNLLFLKELNVDMVGMGPYIPHHETPLYEERNLVRLKEKSDIMKLALKSIAILRHLMPHINIASTTALQVIDNQGREKALASGANVLMPNLTPDTLRENYSIYDNKPGVKEDSELISLPFPIAYNECGDTI